ncbi:MAG: hypothetical protein NT049_14565, partial [Planctomycetota bacterium]|nr:hypothetical protein [Planctomycetota bacterium]
ARSGWLVYPLWIYDMKSAKRSKQPHAAPVHAHENTTSSTLEFTANTDAGRRHSRGSDRNA